jgi:hypothetical protein
MVSENNDSAKLTKSKLTCKLCEQRGEGKPPAVAEYDLPKEESGDPLFYGTIPICEFCYGSVIRTKFPVRITNKAFQKLRGGNYNHDWEKMSIYPGRKGQEWKCRKCGVKFFGTLVKSEGCNIP